MPYASTNRHRALLAIAVTLAWAVSQPPVEAQRPARGDFRGSSVSRSDSGSSSRPPGGGIGTSRGGVNTSRGGGASRVPSIGPSFQAPPPAFSRGSGAGSVGPRGSLPVGPSFTAPNSRGLSQNRQGGIPRVETGEVGRIHSPGISPPNRAALDRNEATARIKSLQTNRGVTSRTELKPDPRSSAGGTPPSSLPRLPIEHPPVSHGQKKPGDITPYRSLFEPLDRAPHGDLARRGGPGGIRPGDPFHVGPDHRGAPHGTPNHDARMHGYYSRYGSHKYPGYVDFGRYGYGYRGSGFSISLGYLGPSLYYEEPYYVPYFVPYTLPVPYVVETQPYVVQSEALQPGAEDAPQPGGGGEIPAAGDAAGYQREAEEAFREHRYEEAARLSNHAIVDDSRNGKLHLFASQTLFALGDYPSAAAAVQQAAALLDRSEWGFVVENYRKFYRGDDYVTQMAKLNEHLVQNPDAAYGYFLRGYHFLFLGHKDAARSDLARAVELENRDELAKELLKIAGGQVPTAAPVLPPPAEAIPLPAAETPAAQQPDS